jgi:hypothetical protein
MPKPEMWELLYFAPPLGGMLVAPRSFAMFGRVWLFNLVALFFWPILMLFLPWRNR